jgi:23S rRNA (cytidine1920-2'-O)/16S rRNA (cytidine1409-2'-O)-methyltransferase
VRRRLDVEMVRRGIVGSRPEAAQAIRSGTVTVAGRPVAKASALVSSDEPIALAGPARKFVSRGGEKLEAALERFRIDVKGRQALDAGASTGGFTDCLLARGASHVVAVDVGYGQLDWRLRQDPRVTVLERTNIRDLRPADLPYQAEVVVADLSFISLEKVMPALAAAGGPDAEFVFLVKPQFEAERSEVGAGGVVADPEVWRRALTSVTRACRRAGPTPIEAAVSPLVGPAGNVEFFLHARGLRGTTAGEARSTPEPDGAEAMASAIDAAIRDGLAMRRPSPGPNGEAHRVG